MKYVIAYIKFAVLRALLWLASRLSFTASQKLGDWLGWFGWRLSSQSRRVNQVNIGLCYPDRAISERASLAAASFRETCTTLMEVPLMWEKPVEKCVALIREIEGEALLDEAISEKKGLILLAPHLGNWELAGLFFSTRYRMSTLYSPPKLADFEHYMVRVRERQGAKLVRGDRRGLVELMSRLRSGGVVGILPDQLPRTAGSVNAPFFGHSVRTMTLAGKLRQKTGAPALITFAERLPGHEGFRLIIRKCEGDIGNLDAVAGASALNRSIEACIERCPTQYQWEYKRFRHAGPGFTNPYKAKGSQQL